MKAPFPTSKAYVIGIANYLYGPWQLNTPLHDAEALSTQLRDKHGFETTLLADPTAAQMQELFDQIRRESKEENARIFIYYAGHGVQRDSAQGLKGFFLPADARPDDEASMVSMESLAEALRNVPARHLLLVLDCCFAGTFRMPSKRGLDLGGLTDPLRRQHFDIFCNFPSRLVLSSTSYRQKALDRLEDGDANSPFNRFLCRAISGEADYTGDRLVTATELKTYLADSVSQITDYAGNLQSVGLDALEGDGEGEFLFFLDGFNAAQLPEQAYLNPYKGLKAYESADAALFFGRQKATQSLLAKTAESPFVMVAGASGTGKSSLVKAGLLPRLADQQIAIMRPGKNPMAVLPAADTWDVLVVDQWEELITQTTDEQEVEQFYTEIRRLLDGGKRIIGTVRADFEAQTRNEILEPYWVKGRFVVPPFTSEEYHDVIVQPAKRVACLFEDRELVQQIEQEVAQQPGPLPLLSFMLSELFERAKSESARYREIKRRHYEAVGGVSGALRNKAEEVFAAMPDAAHRDAMRRLMLRMVALSAGEMAGRRVFLADLDFHDPAEDKRIESIIQQLDEAKLIRRDADDAGRRFIEPAHDALVRAWKRLWDWVRELGEENLLLHAKLVNDVIEYLGQQSSKKFLWHENPRLEQVGILMKKNSLIFNLLERRFIIDSINKKKKLRRLFLMGGILVTAVITTMALIAWIQRGYAKDNLKKAEENQKIAEERLRDFEVADSIRLLELRSKELLNINKFINDGDVFANSFDFEIALKYYQKADSILMKFPEDPEILKKKELVFRKISNATDKTKFQK